MSRIRARKQAFAEKATQDASAGIAPDPLGSQKRSRRRPKVISRLRAMWGTELDCTRPAALGTATFVPGVPAHSWHRTAALEMSIGRKGMSVAAKTLALTAWICSYRS